MIEIAVAVVCALFGMSVLTVVFSIVRAVIGLVWSVLTWPFRLLFGPSRPTSYRPSPTPDESPYTRDWATVSRKYKESRDWRCEGCGVYCGVKNDRRLLHVHHRDLNPQNNSMSNLDALCVVCHSERPGAGHRRLAGAITKDGRRRAVERLRREQGR